VRRSATRAATKCAKKKKKKKAEMNGNESKRGKPHRPDRQADILQNETHTSTSWAKDQISKQENYNIHDLFTIPATISGE
jgi:hypothetical protein